MAYIYEINLINWITKKKRVFSLKNFFSNNRRLIFIVRHSSRFLIIRHHFYNSYADVVRYQHPTPVQLLYIVVLVSAELAVILWSIQCLNAWSTRKQLIFMVMSRACVRKETIWYVLFADYFWNLPSSRDFKNFFKSFSVSSKFRYKPKTNIFSYMTQYSKQSFVVVLKFQVRDSKQK